MKHAARSAGCLGLGLLAAGLLAAGCGRTSTEHTATNTPGGTTAPASNGGLRLAPDPAFASSRIEVVFDDPAIDATTCTFAWKRNGAPLAGAAGSYLNPSQFSRGDRITVEATIPGEPPRVMSSQVSVLNMPPKIAAVSLVMAASSEQTKLESSVQSADADGDAVTYKYQWFRNGAPIADAQQSGLPASALSRGDRLQVEVTAEDRESASVPVRSDVFQVQNLPPRITSRPAKPGPTDKAFRYQMAADDPDRDGLRFDLLTGPAGMTIGPEGLVEWVLPSPEARKGDHPVKLKASDQKGGEAVQEFTVHFD